MRKLWLLPAPGLALLLVFLLLGGRDWFRGGGGRRGQEGEETARRRATAGKTRTTGALDADAPPGEALDETDVVGLPPGPLHIHVVTGDRILEASVDIGEPGDLLLASSRFRDTTGE